MIAPKKYPQFCRTLFLLLICWPFLISAQVPQQMNYQGLLTDPATGSPIADGNYQVVLAIYDLPAGGSAIWSETHTIETRQGLFSILLGSTNLLTPNVLSGPEKYLGIKIAADPEMTPRRRIVSSAYAVLSHSAQQWSGLDTADFRNSDGNPPNEGSNHFSWDNLTDVPEGFADGIDNGGGGGNTLDEAYDQNGPGAGRFIIADAGPVNIQGDDGLLVSSSVGISVPAPQADFHVNGDVLVDGGGDIILNGLVGINEPNPLNALEVNGNALILGQNNRLQVSGKLGVATFPDTDFHVAGSGKFTGQDKIFTVEGKVAIGDLNTPLADLHVFNENGVLFQGTHGLGPIPFSGFGTRMMWYPGKSALRAGRVNGARWNDSNIGNYSAAFGLDAQASGIYSFAGGLDNIASGTAATAFGQHNQASGNYATALGDQNIASGTGALASGGGSSATSLNAAAIGTGNTASGIASVAFGQASTASGPAAISVGWSTIAAGPYSFAGGTGASVDASHQGTFLWGDNLATIAAIPFTSEAANEFAARATGGVRFVTGVLANGEPQTGVKLTPNGSSWEAISDATKKENFHPLNGESVLEKIASFHLGTWNYIGQNPQRYRHYGPMAQDFFAAFGNDGIGKIGSDTTIACADFHGVNFTAIQALEKRTTDLQQQLNSLQQRYQSLQDVHKTMGDKIAHLENVLKKLLSGQTVLPAAYTTTASSVNFSDQTEISHSRSER